MTGKEIHSNRFVQRVNQYNVNKNLIKYNLFMKKIMNLEHHSEEKSLAQKAYDQSKRIPTGALAAIFSDPSFSYWTYLSTCILNRFENNEPIPISDLPYIKGIINKNAKNILRYHLLELNRFLVAASVLSKTDILTVVNILDGGLYIPFLGIFFQLEDTETSAVVRFDMNGDRSTFKLNERSYSDFDNILFKAEQGVNVVTTFADNIYIQPSLKSSGGRAVLDCIDPFFRFGWSNIYKNPDGSRYIELTFEEINETQKSFAEAIQLIEKYWEEMAFQLSITIRTIHAVKSPLKNQHMSCTSEQFFGGILTSLGNKYLLAEAIVHEYSHNLLNAIISSGEIFNGKPPSEEIYYSPWREDPRSISGVLHAVFVFANVLELLQRISKQLPTNGHLKVRKCDIRVKLEKGIQVLNQYNFERPLVNEIITNVENKINEKDIALSESDMNYAIQAQTEHLDNSKKNYPDLIFPG